MRSFLTVAAVVLVHAVVQTLLVLGDPAASGGVGGVVRVVASAVALLLAVWIIARVLSSQSAGRTAVAVLLLAVVAAAASLLSTLLTPVVLVLGAPFLVADAGLFRRALPAAGLVVLGIVLAALSWAGAVAAEFFLGGPVAALLTWLWFGAVGAALLRGWAGLAR